MVDRRDILQDYVSDMLGLEKHIDGAIDRQIDDDRMQKSAAAIALVRRISQTLKTHQDILKRQLDSLGGHDTKSALKSTVTAVTGAAAGLFDKVRPGDPVSRNLRDNYTALNMAAVSYTMLHTTALALKQQALADLAIRHLEDLAPLIMELGEIIPAVVAEELAVEDKAIDSSIGRVAAANTLKAWKSSAYGH